MPIQVDSPEEDVYFTNVWFEYNIVDYLANMFSMCIVSLMLKSSCLCVLYAGFSLEIGLACVKAVYVHRSAHDNNLFVVFTIV